MAKEKELRKPNKKQIGKIPNEYCSIRADFKPIHYKIFYKLIQRMVGFHQRMRDARLATDEEGEEVKAFINPITGDRDKDLSKVFLRACDVKDLFVRNATKEEIEDTVSELNRSQIQYKSNKTFKSISVFEFIEYDYGGGSLVAKFTETFLDTVVGVSSNFTLYNMVELSKLRSVYSIKLYLLGMRASTLPKVVRKYQDFRTELDIPDTYRTSEVNRLLNTAITDIKKKTKLDLEYENIREVSNGKITHIGIKARYSDKLYSNDTRNQINVKVAEEEIPW